MKKIDYVIISSDDNPTYSDFYDIVSRRWNEIGIKTYYLHITNKDEIIENEYGIIHRIKFLENFPKNFQSQIIRLFACKFIKGTILISDIDMLPLSEKYFKSYLSELEPDNIILYSGQPYSDVPFFPMCYILSNTAILKKCLQIENLNFEEFCNLVKDSVSIKWNSDEHFFYNSIIKNKIKYVLKKRDFKNRIDRNNWNYNFDLLKKDFYIDSHLLRPLNVYENEIKKLINDLNK